MKLRWTPLVGQQRKKTTVAWYRSPIDPENLRLLNQRNDVKGFIQAGGYLSLIVATGAVSYYSALFWPWYITLPILYFHGTCWGFQINAMHELVHSTVFKTKWVNQAFLDIFSFLGWHHHHHFWSSHTEHHKYTLHPPDDLEVVLRMRFSLSDFLKSAIINPWYLWDILKVMCKLSLGRVDIDERGWSEALYPDSTSKERHQVVTWARILLVGHGLILIISLAMGWWMLPVVFTFAPFYGGALHFLCNNTQHAGLVDKTPDLRLCCRTIYLNPFFQFLYWHMNYHTEHHMYAAVPCYNLEKLHRLIKEDLPHCPNGLIETWKQIIVIQQRQKINSKYQFVAALPNAKAS